MQLKMSYYKWEETTPNNYFNYMYYGYTHTFQDEICHICRKSVHLDDGFYLVSNHSVSIKHFIVSCSETCRNIFLLKQQ